MDQGEGCQPQSSPPARGDNIRSPQSAHQSFSRALSVGALGSGTPCTSAREGERAYSGRHAVDSGPDRSQPERGDVAGDPRRDRSVYAKWGRLKHLPGTPRCKMWRHSVALWHVDAVGPRRGRTTRNTAAPASSSLTIPRRRRDQSSFPADVRGSTTLAEGISPTAFRTLQPASTMSLCASSPRRHRRQVRRRRGRRDLHPPRSPTTSIRHAPRCGAPCSTQRARRLGGPWLPVASA
jgi:hypothetical protein